MTDLSVDARDTTEGFFSRWVVIPFTGFYPAGVADTTLLERLTRQSELQGLLRMTVGGLQQVMRRGQFTMPASVSKATEKFRSEADPMRAFIDEHVREATDNRVPRAEVYATYVAWAIENGFHRMSAMKFYEQFLLAGRDVISHNVGTVKTTTERYLTGIRLTNVTVN